MARRVHDDLARSGVRRTRASWPERSILLVEDDPTLQELMGACAVRMGFRVLAASHYAAAVEHLDATTPDVACLDIGLPTRSGYDLCEYIRGHHLLGSTPILVTSEVGSPSDRAYAEQAGANGFLVKPFSMAEFGASLDALRAGASPIGAFLSRTGGG